MDERSSVRPVQDTRRPAYGWGRILVGVFAVFGAILLIPSLTTLLRSPDEEPAVWSLNLLGGGLYILLAVCVAHNGRRMWMSDPRRIVANAERITELSDTLTESITEKARAVQEGRTHKTLRSGRDR